MKILFAASEVTPLIGTSELADMIGVLPKHLEAQGMDVRVVVPHYTHLVGDVGEKVSQFTMLAGPKTLEVSVSQTILPETNIQLYLVKLNQGFEAKTIYPAPKEGEPDRFLLFSQAVLQWLQTSTWQPEVIHVHDWPTAVIPYLVDQKQLPYRTLLTIHNLEEQGKVARTTLVEAGINPPGTAKEVNLLKLGILHASKINTISQTYAKEIVTREYGEHLQATLRQRAKDLSGILSGVDYARYAPHLSNTLEREPIKHAIENKIVSKELIRQETGLAASSKPLFSVVGRIDQRKGLDLLEQLIKETAFIEHAQLVVLGVGSQELERRLTRLAKKHQGQMAAIVEPDDELAFRLLAGSDFLIMPSRIEPCGLGQLIALSHGTLPIVRQTGGLADTVVDVVSKPTQGTGFVFKAATYTALAGALNHALDLYQQKSALYATMEQAMQQDFAWGKSARQYVAVYKAALTSRRTKAKPTRKATKRVK